MGFGGLLYAPTFDASFAYDDVDYLNLAADALAGKRGYWQVVFRPHLEHLVPVLRILFQASASFFGIEALPFRLLTFFAHLGTGFLLGLLGRRYADGSDAVGIAVAVAYVVPAGFSSMWVWLMAGAGVPLGLLFLAASLVALAYHQRIGLLTARLAAGIGIILALACENTLAPLVAGPILLDEYERRRRGARHRVGPFAVFGAVVGTLWGVFSSVLYARLTGEHFSFSIRHGIMRAAFLLISAPFRYFFPGSPLTYPNESPRSPLVTGGLFGLVILSAIAALFLSTFSRRKLPPIAVVAALTAVGPVGVVVLVGMRRWTSSYAELWAADRYFFTLLVPIALAGGVFAKAGLEAVGSWPKSFRVALAVVLGIGFAVEVGAHRQALKKNFPKDDFEEHERRFRQLRSLGADLCRAALALPPGSPPVSFPDGAFTFPDIHLNRLSSAFLLHVAAPCDTPRLRVARDGVSERDQKILNPILEQWAQGLGEKLPYVSIVNGQLVNAREAGMADFRHHPHADKVVSGFYDWDGASRWMGARGELQLLMTSPRIVLRLAVAWKAIQTRYPEWASMNLTVSLVVPRMKQSSLIGELRITRDGFQEYRLSVPETLAATAQGRSIHLILKSDRSWRPVDVLPGSRDPRQLTVQVFRAGFEPVQGVTSEN